MVVEDNGYVISSPTRRTNALALNVLALHIVRKYREQYE